MAKAKHPIPEGLHTITPQLNVRGAVEALDFYRDAFGAIELDRAAGPNGKILHAAMKIGDSHFFLNDEMPGEKTCASPSTVGGTTVVMQLYVTDCDKVYNRAVAAGARVSMPMADQFWGDRYGTVTDPYGHVWGIATRKEDLTPAELVERGRQFMENMSHR